MSKDPIQTFQEVKTELHHQKLTWSVFEDEDRTLKITTEYQFKSFQEAVDFVNEIATPIERLDHHPNISILYNKVSLLLWTHASGGITKKDFTLAKEIDDIYAKRHIVS